MKCEIQHSTKKFQINVFSSMCWKSHVDELNSLFEVWKITRRRVYFTSNLSTKWNKLVDVWFSTRRSVKFTHQTLYFYGRNSHVDELNSLFEGWKITRRRVYFTTVQIVYFCARNSHVDELNSLFEVWKITCRQVYFTSITQQGKINLSTCDYSPFEEWNSLFKLFISVLEIHTSTS